MEKKADSCSFYGDVTTEKVLIQIFYLKGAVSQNSAKLGNYKMPVKIKRNTKITA